MLQGGKERDGVVSDGLDLWGKKGVKGVSYRMLIRDRRFARKPYWRVFRLAVRFD